LNYKEIRTKETGESQAVGRHKGRGKHNIVSYSVL